MEHELPLAQQVATPNVSESLSPLSKEVDPANQNRFLPYFGVVFRFRSRRSSSRGSCDLYEEDFFQHDVLGFGHDFGSKADKDHYRRHECVCVCVITAACRSLHESHLEPQSSCQCCCGSLCTRRRRRSHWARFLHRRSNHLKSFIWPSFSCERYTTTTTNNWKLFFIWVLLKTIGRSTMQYTTTMYFVL